jgi:hypothetical protein
MVVEAALPGAVEAVGASLTDGFATAFVLVVGSDVPVASCNRTEL